MSELIVDIATRKEYIIDVKRSGENAQPCPKCSQDRKNKTAKSFSYDAMKEVGYCQNCNSSFAKKKEFIPVKQQKKEYVRPQWTNVTQLPDKLVQWFKNRGISQQTLIETKVTFAEEWMPQINGKAKVMCFNYFRDGELINTKYRDNAKNFKLVKDAELIFYNLDAIKGQKEVVICEGEADCLSYVEVGIKNVVSVPNGAAKGSLKLDYLDNCWEWFEKVDKIYLATDDDEAGRILQEELARRLGKEKCFRVSFYGCKDANELLQKDPLKLPQTIKDATEYPIEGVYTAKDIESEIWDLKRNGLKPACGIGIESVDKMITYEGGYVTLVTGIVGHGKALDINTPIPTPNGFVNMGDLQVGDEVFGEDGLVTKIIAVSAVLIDRPCYKVVFSDGSEVICDENHLWLTDSEKSRRSQRNTVKNNRLGRGLKIKGTDQTHKKTHPSVITTKEISETLYDGRTKNHLVKNCLPIQTESKNLKINPYVLGAWLGDGRTDYGSITAAEKEIRDEIEKRGYRLTVQKSAKYQYGIAGLVTTLREEGVLGNKHIPTKYLFASEYDRLELLKGLMDTDGYCGKDGRCEFTSIKECLADDVYALVASLGLKPTKIIGNATLNGRFISKKYRISFTPKFDVFTLQRKNDRIVRKDRNTKVRYIVSCERVESRPVKCISVNNNSHLYLCGKSFIPTHNSEYTDQMIVGLNLLHGWKAAYFSPENWPIKLHHSKLATKLTGGNFNTESDNVTADAIRYCADNFYMICPEVDFSLQSILDTATQLVKKHGVKALVIDAWNKLEHMYTGNESQYISKELDKLDMFAKRTGVHVFLIAHPTKMKKDDELNYSVPDGYSISGSAAFFSKPANVVCVYRKYYQDGTSQPEIFCQKVKFKHWGTGRGSATLIYNHVNGRYTDKYQDNENYLAATQETLDFSEPQEPAMKPNQSFITPIQTELIYDGESTEFSEGSEDCPF